MPDYVLEYTPPHEEDEAPIIDRIVISSDEPLSEEELAAAQDEFAKGRSIDQIAKKVQDTIREAETRTPSEAQIEYVTIPRIEYEALIALQTKGEG